MKRIGEILKEEDTINTLHGIFSVRSALAAGAVFLIASSFLGWTDEPITGWLKGYKLRLSENLPAILSYGLVCLLAGALSFAAILVRFRIFGLIAGVLGIFISMNFLLSFALTDSRKLVVSSDLNQQEKRIISFNRFLPPNNGVEPTFDQSMGVDTIENRFYDTLHFATLGWYTAIVGSIFAFGAYIRSGLSRRARNAAIILPALLLLIYVTLVVSPHLAAEHHRSKGDYNLAVGNYAEALKDYDKAEKLDGNIAYFKEFHLNKGKAYYFSGRSDVADYYIYKAALFMQEAKFPLSLFYLNLADIISPSIPRQVWNSFVSWNYINYGLSQYRAGLVSSAIDLWKKAIDADSSQIQPYYYLSRAFYEAAEYEDSIESGKAFLQRSRNKLMNANVSSDIADSYYRLKQFDLARQFYLKSQNLDKDENMRAVMSLVGR